MPLLDPTDLARVKNLQLFARTVVEGFATGMHASPHKGMSVEFRQHRPYVPGDEIRHIDWKVFGRTDRYHIREFEEETNLRCNLVVDVSGSMGYKGTGGVEKLDYARRTAACLSWLMMSQADSVGLVTFDRKVRTVLPPRSKVSHLRHLMEDLANAEPASETDAGASLLEITPQLKRRGLVIVISDCFGDADSFLKSLAMLKHRGHEVIVFQIFDRDELEFPFKQWTRFEGMEDGSEHMVDPAALRATYLSELEKWRDELSRGCRRRRIDLVPLVTDQPYADALSRYLAWRAR
ncbi:MAG: DUF58 domain-containing protein [Verrucomicrobiota bacterium]